jgi:hypothetical protein
MDVFKSSWPNQEAQPNTAPITNYGTLGPTSDMAPSASGGAGPASTVEAPRLGPYFAVAIGVLLAVLVGSIGSTRPSWAGFTNFVSTQSGETSPAQSAKDLNHLDRLKPQKQAETLLELAVGHSDAAMDQISTHVDRWQGYVKWNSQIATLTTAALNSSDMRVRESGIEVELSAYGLAKNSAGVNYLLKSADSADHAKKIWALWALGLMGNRGVETDRIVQVLTAHLKDSDEDSRHWAVEGLALVGGPSAITPLLQTMHDDPSPEVRESAACSLAQAGMFSREQRLSAVPQLVNYTDDPSLDARTHAWAFQALNDITRQHLPNDSTAWRRWYESTKSY